MIAMVIPPEDTAGIVGDLSSKMTNMVREDAENKKGIIKVAKRVIVMEAQREVDEPMMITSIESTLDQAIHTGVVATTRKILEHHMPLEESRVEATMTMVVLLKQPAITQEIQEMSACSVVC